LRSTLPAVVLCVAALPAHAQQMISDDFESGGLGKWTTNVNGTPMLSVTSAAAHRGDAGLSIDMPMPVSGADTAYLSFSPVPAFAGSELYLRYWVHASLGGSTAQVPISAFVGPSLLTFSANIPANDGGPSAWTLNELYLTGLGTDAGVVTLYSQGIQTLHQSFDFTGWSISEIRVGLVAAGPGGYSGTIDYDDIRTSTSPPAALVRFDGGVPRVGSCVPLKFTLLSSTGIATPTPHDCSIFTPPELGPLFSDATCTTPAAAVTLDAGDDTVWGYIVPVTPGIFMGELTSDDYLGGHISGNIGPPLPDGGHDAGAPDAGPPLDAGTDGGEVDAGAPDAGVPPFTEDVACGCSSAEAPAWLALLALASLRRRRL
jgi:MYXO-CTERM domain-containing protein